MLLTLLWLLDRLFPRPMPQPNARRCTPCDVSFPFRDSYTKCPLCRRDTWTTHDPAVLTLKQAQHAVDVELAARNDRDLKREAFESFYAERGFACSLCGEPVVVLQPPGQSACYAICFDCDDRGPSDTHTLGALGGMDHPAPADF